MRCACRRWRSSSAASARVCPVARRPGALRSLRSLRLGSVAPADAAASRTAPGRRTQVSYPGLRATQGAPPAEGRGRACVPGRRAGRTMADAALVRDAGARDRRGRTARRTRAGGMRAPGRRPRRASRQDGPHRLDGRFHQQLLSLCFCAACARRYAVAEALGAQSAGALAGERARVVRELRARVAAEARAVSPGDFDRAKWCQGDGAIRHHGSGNKFGHHSSLVW